MPRAHRGFAVTVLCCACGQPIDMDQEEAQRAARSMIRRGEKVSWEHQPDCPAPVDRMAARCEAAAETLRSGILPTSLALLEIADDAARLAAKAEYAAGRGDLAAMIQDGARHTAAMALDAAARYEGPLCGAVGDATGLLTCVFPRHGGDRHGNALGTEFRLAPRGEGAAPDAKALPRSDLPAEARERIERTEAADAERLAAARAFLDERADERVITVKDLRDAILSNTRSNRAGETPGAYAFPGVPADALADFSAYNLVRRLALRTEPLRTGS